MTDIPTNMSEALERAFIARLEADARKANAEAQAAEHDARSKRIYAENNALSQRQDRASSFNKHEFHFIGEVCYETVAPCLLTLARWHHLDPTCPMTIYMDSPGGTADDGFHLFDQIDHYSIRGGGQHEVTMVVRGMAASMAGILVQAADHRVMGKRAQMMIHQVSTWAGGSTGDLEDSMEHLKILNQQIIDAFMERAHAINREEFTEKWKRTNWWITATEALRLGFVDRIG